MKPKRILGGATAIVMIASLSSVAAAQSVSCASEIDSETVSAADLVACMVSMQEEIDLLRQAAPVSSGDVVPIGAVIAFDDPNGCPGGWSDVGAEWRGRNLVAAVRDSNDIYGFRRIGGAETHVLTRAEMPSHSHGFSGQAVTRGGWGGRATRTFAVGGSEVVSSIAIGGTIAPSGSNNAHNNMPPYIALYFCKRDSG